MKKDIPKSITSWLMASPPPLVKQIRWNYRNIVLINGALIGLGITGLVHPTVSALIHNTSTLSISLRSMKNLLP